MGTCYIRNRLILQRPRKGHHLGLLSSLHEGILELPSNLNIYFFIIVHSTKLLNFDWSRAVQLIPNCPWKRRNFVECTINHTTFSYTIRE